VKVLVNYVNTATSSPGTAREHYVACAVRWTVAANDRKPASSYAKHSFITGWTAPFRWQAACTRTQIQSGHVCGCLPRRL
jgi:hypothetical protein